MLSDTPTNDPPAWTARLQRHDLPSAGGYVTWRCMGDGLPLVLIHGGHGAWTHWFRNLELLAQRFKVCVVDLPGYGDSSAVPSGSLDSLLAMTLQSLNALVGQQHPIALAGFSFGGLVAARLYDQEHKVKLINALRAACLILGRHSSGKDPTQPKNLYLFFTSASLRMNTIVKTLIK